MNIRDARYLESFFEDIPFPIHKRALVEESLESSLPADIREALLLLPDMIYSSKEEVTRELLGQEPDDGDTPKKDQDTLATDETDDKMDHVVDLDEFTQLGDAEDHENV
jgi:hypothetical protein